MAKFKESKVVVAAAQAALKEASDEADNRQIKVGEVKALYDDTKAALAEFENRSAFQNQKPESGVGKAS